MNPFDLESIEVLETYMNGRPTGLNKTYPMDFPGGSFLVFGTGSAVEGAVSMKRKGSSPFMQQERKTAKYKRR